MRWRERLAWLRGVVTDWRNIAAWLAANAVVSSPWIFFLILGFITGDAGNYATAGTIYAFQMLPIPIETALVVVLTVWFRKMMGGKNDAGTTDRRGKGLPQVPPHAGGEATALGDGAPVRTELERERPGEKRGQPDR
jgi:hypothetical protein